MRYLILFLNKSKYTKSDINSYTSEILQFSLKYCIKSDEISDDYDNMYYPLYSENKIIDSFIPDNDIKERNIYDCYSKIERYLNNYPLRHGVYIYTFNIDKKNEVIHIEFLKGNGYHERS